MTIKPKTHKNAAKLYKYNNILAYGTRKRVILQSDSTRNWLRYSTLASLFC